MPKRLPQLLGKMGHHRADELDHRLEGLGQNPCLALARTGKFLERVGERAHLRHRDVEAEILEMLAHRGDRLVGEAPSGLPRRRDFGRLRRAGLRQRRRRFGDETMEPIEITPGALDPGLGPFEIALRGRVGEHEQARGVGAVGVDDARRRHDVLARLRHLFGAPDAHRRLVRGRHVCVADLFHLLGSEPERHICLRILLEKRPVRDHALGEQSGERLVDAEMAGLFHRPGEETRIQKVQNRVLDPADILIDGEPVIDRRARYGDARARRAKAGEVPRRIDEGVERIGVAPRRMAAGGAIDVLPGRVVIERISRPLEGHVRWQLYRQIAVGHRHDAARIAVDHRNRAAPITLPADQPVAQAIDHGRLAHVLRRQPPADRRLGFFDAHAVEKIGVDDDAVLDERLTADREALGI